MELLPHWDVAAGIIWRGKRILIAQRSPEGSLGGRWEFPGGRRERGETLEECLLREIGEELGIAIRINRPFMTVDHAYPHVQVTLHFFDCTFLRGRPRALGCHSWRWVRPSELSNFPFLPADMRAVETLQRISKGPKRRLLLLF